MKILLDMDGTIGAFDEAFVEYIQKHGYGFDWVAYDDWDIAKFITGTSSYEESQDVFRRSLDDISFWESIKPMPYAREVLQYHAFYHDITVVTMPWKMVDPYQKVKHRWLRKHLPFIHESQVMFSPGDKWNIPGDVIIDDKPEVLEKCYGKMLTIKPIQPYNTKVKADFSFHDWREVPEILERCEIELLREKVG